MSTIIVALSDFLADPEKPVDLTSLPIEEAREIIIKSYGFLSTAVEVTIENGLAIVTLPEEKTPKIDQALARFGRGVSKAKQGDYAGAINLLKQTLEVLPAHTDARRNLAMAYLESGNQEEAINHLIDVLRLDPKDVWGYILLGNIYGMYRKDLDTAEPFYQKAYRINPNDPYLLHNFASLKAQKNQLDEAIEMFKRGIELEPSYPNSYLGLAMAYASHGKNEMALAALPDLFAKCREHDSRDIQVFERARQFTLHLNQQMATDSYESYMAYVHSRATAVEAITGYPVEIKQDDSLQGVTAKSELAWKHHVSQHRVLYRDASKAVLPHLITHELEHILLEWEARKEQKNKLFVVADQHREFANKQLRGEAERIQKAGLDRESTSQFIARIVGGLANQLYNCPLDMVIEKRIFTKYEILRPTQFVSLYTTQTENLGVLSNSDIKKLSPRLVFRANQAMNCSYALYTDWLCKGMTDYAKPYKSTEAFSLGQKLFRSFLDVEAHLHPGDEYALVNEYAKILNLEGWFSVVDDFTVPSTSPQGTTNPELLKQKESATVMYCLDALKRFENLSMEKIREIAFEIGMLGTSGIDYTKPDRRYSLKSLPGEQFSGLQLLTLMYVGFQRIDPSLDSGLDFREPYLMALKVFGEPTN
jgi:cytochrome c-type biogenesis protein CcmH/NrfG